MICDCRCQNVQTARDLSNGYRAGLSKSVGALTHAHLSLLEKQMTWTSYIRELRLGMRRSRLRQIPQLEAGRSADLGAAAFSKLFGSASQPVKYQSSTKPGALPDEDRSKKAEGRKNMEKFQKYLSAHPRISKALSSLRAALKQNREPLKIDRGF